MASVVNNYGGDVTGSSFIFNGDLCQSGEVLGEQNKDFGEFEGMMRNCKTDEVQAVKQKVYVISVLQAKGQYTIWVNKCFL